MLLLYVFRRLLLLFSLIPLRSLPLKAFALPYLENKELSNTSWMINDVVGRELQPANFAALFWCGADTI